MKASTSAKWLALFGAVFLMATGCNTSGKVRMATAPVWFFKAHSLQIPAACTAVNLHNHDIELRTELIYHIRDPYPIGPETLYPIVETQTIKPGYATVISSNGTSLDNHLVRCLFDYTGDPDKVKAAIIIETVSGKGTRSLSLPAEVISVE